ncbi:hypothetical protein [Frankia sp. CiP3]|uniref:hypothetical protein n=1 Tax=Frankia sp. CiP3 TaxID=2880971 RepID=UPI001EF73036|nr:hypothetical protein [Frankia sp. CiP3]
MPTMSVFAFERQSFQSSGPFHQMHRLIDSGFTWEASWDLPAVHAIVAYVRPDTEVCQSLSDIVNYPAVIKFVRDTFSRVDTAGKPVRNPELRGPIRTSYQVWKDIAATPGAKIDQPGAHQDSDLVNTISFDFHCNTDAVFTALSGTATIYVFYSLDGSGNPQVRIEGFSTRVWDDEPARPDAGLPGIVGEVVAATLMENRPFIQAMLDRALQRLAAGRTFSDLYFLPGTGVKINAPVDDNADDHVALCLVPR